MSSLARMITRPKVPSSKAPIVVLHGFLGYSRSWTSMCRKIAEESNRDVHAIDLRNHGHSPHYSSFHFNELVTDLMEYIDLEIEHPKCVVMGHSLGGLITCQYLQRTPSNVSAGIIVDISPAVLRPDKLNEFIGYIDAMMAAMHPMKPTTLKEMDERLSTRIADPKMRSFLLTNLTRREGSFEWLPNLPVLQRSLKSGDVNFRPYSTTFTSKTPVHFIFGGESIYYKTKDRIRNIEHIFGSPLPDYVKESVMGNCHHQPHIESPAQFLKLVTDYLEDFP